MLEINATAVHMRLSRGAGSGWPNGSLPRGSRKRYEVSPPKPDRSDAAELLPPRNTHALAVAPSGEYHGRREPGEVAGVEPSLGGMSLVVLVAVYLGLAAFFRGIILRG